MVAEEIIKNIELDDITKSHAHIISNNIEMLFLDVYNIFNNTYGLETVVLSVTPNQLGKLAKVVQAEIVARRGICNKQNVLRVSDLNQSLLSEVDKDTVKKVYMHVLLPRYINNTNTRILIKLMNLCVPLGIHLLMYHQADSREDNIELIDSACYWTLLPELDLVRTKTGK